MNSYIIAPLFLLLLSTLSNASETISRIQDRTDRPSIHKDSILTSLSVGISDNLKDQDPVRTKRPHNYSSSLNFKSDLPIFHLLHMHTDVIANSSFENMRGNILQRTGGHLSVGYIFLDIEPHWNFIPSLGANYTTPNKFRGNDQRELFPMLSLLWFCQGRDSGNVVALTLNYTHLDQVGESILGDKPHSEYALTAEVEQIIPLNQRKNLAVSYTLLASLSNYYRLTPTNQVATFNKDLDFSALLGLTF